MIALIDPFKEEMQGKGFPNCYLKIQHDMWTGRISLAKSDDASSHEKDVHNYIKECEIEDITEYTFEDVMELASDYVGDHVVPEGVDDDEGNSEWYVDLIDRWSSIFAYNVAELMMCAYFVKHRDAVDR